ncbi:MAG: cytochrome c-type biogenesis protein CcmH [Alphaproteobacteria bacterium]|nr:cytochrome c-type biogenesis protein CcmH [Alphaproteobacteria bacterium]
MIRLLMITWLCIAAFPVSAQVTQSETALTDSSQEQRARALFRELRCEVCDGQTIADSNAGLAQDMRILVRDKLREGQSDEAILGFFSERYGQDILMRPPMNSETAPLWLAPIFVLLMGGWFIIRYFARKKQSHF